MPDGKLRPIGTHAYSPPPEQVLANERYVAAIMQALEDERKGVKDLKREAR